MRIRSILSYASWIGRHAATFGACFLAFRLLFGAVTVAKARSSEARGTQSEGAPSGRSGLDQLLRSRDSSRDLSSIEELAEAAKEKKPERTAEPQVHLRSILVDFGPPRSELFINGRKVGNTPYAGQIGCRDGDKIRVQVVPRVGLPLEKMMLCPASAAPVGELE